jgi:hypothetical protein
MKPPLGCCDQSDKVKLCTIYRDFSLVHRPLDFGPAEPDLRSG